MAAIDKIYVNSFEKYKLFKDWCKTQPKIKDKYGNEISLINYVFNYTEWKDGAVLPVCNNPYYIDAYLIRSCPFDFIQEELMLSYGKWTQDEIEKAYEIETVADEKEVAMKLLDWGKTHLDTMDYTDMIWLPNVLNLKPIGLQYDYIMVDECQDMNKAERELVMRCFKNGTRMISVGDENQLIYQFSGSDKDSLNTLKSLPNTVCLPLSISYRCADSIVEYAQKIVPSIEKNDDHREGKVLESVPLCDVNDGDMVLCRTNAPLVALYNRYLNMGKKSYIVGKDIGSNMK